MLLAREEPRVLWQPKFQIIDRHCCLTGQMTKTSYKNDHQWLLLKEYVRPNFTIDLKNQPKSLSPRELEVLRHVASGITSVEIANKLNISKHTVDNHRKSMLRKTQSTNTLQLIQWAVKRNVIQL